MWKEILPNNCPPNTAKELEMEVYRILANQVPSETDFQSYFKLYPSNPRYNNDCKARAISFYNTFENASTALRLAIDRGNNIGNFIGKYQLTKSDGKNEIKIKSGHISTWFYSKWDLNDFKPIEVIKSK